MWSLNKSCEKEQGIINPARSISQTEAITIQWNTTSCEELSLPEVLQVIHLRPILC